jgi:hypothetical protein
VGDLIIGDVHGCAEELSRLILLAGKPKISLVGDLFTKGPDPLGVWQLIRTHNTRSVLGNQDAWLLENWGRTHLTEALQDFCRQAPEVRDWLADLPLFIEEDPLLVVHAGLHPTEGIRGTTRHMALNMRRFPTEAAEQPFWYDAGWQGPETVVFGHDARRGLVRRELDGRPVAIGLDSGCVYGGKLSGWIPEEDRILSIPAARIYKAV